MNILSEELNGLIDLRVPQPLRILVKKCFHTLSLFQLQHMEDKYIAISHNEDMDGIFYWDNFQIFLRNDLESVLRYHKIELSETSEFKLSDLNDFVECLHRIQHLEDYTHIARVLSDIENPRYSFLKIINFYSKIEFVVLMDNIGKIDDTLIDGLRQLADAKIFNEEIEELSKDYTLFFMNYLGDQECLGRTVFEKGYDSIMTLEETCKMLDVDFSTYFENKAKAGQPSFAALDILSLYMITSDGREKPLELIKEKMESYFEDLNLQQTVYNIFLALFSDFKLHYDTVVAEHGGLNNANAR